MVGQKEARSLAWLWLHHALGWKHVHFLSMGIGENGVNDTGKLPTTLLQNILSEEHEQDDDEFNHYINRTFLEEKRSDDELDDDDELNSMMANASHISYLTTLTIKSDTNSQSLIKSNLTYSHYLHFYY